MVVCFEEGKAIREEGLQENGTSHRYFVIVN